MLIRFSETLCPLSLLFIALFFFCFFSYLSPCLYLPFLSPFPDTPSFLFPSPTFLSCLLPLSFLFIFPPFYPFYLILCFSPYLYVPLIRLLFLLFLCFTTPSPPSFSLPPSPTQLTTSIPVTTLILFCISSGCHPLLSKLSLLPCCLRSIKSLHCSEVKYSCSSEVKQII